ncbi:class III extradiol dioxygenase subunit B-like domain-containing protein [Streptomyces sp. DSM 44915]|uniref:Class III extradiol dioxygenase subunit B-like domain-containing protein n=1 Tax=Streptomyces chisholmiae TaxID=3075540 RepID=A0ABU2JN83_9ACTN|nr:class III extradiol dioxygenase subunit B-like domain-containing protein [Streptomyces sp. DSM 44915]MDT0266169.1 class III extradiol dioxygenase subunit B-like domain-containing protein [Streptomyces sp. DSM 44915]
MLVAAAVCPCPPLLIPEVAAGAAAELDAARAACFDAVAVLAAARPDRLLLVGAADPAESGGYPAGSRGSLRGFGVALDVTLGRGEPTERALPPSLTVGAWLLERTRWQAAEVAALALAEAADPTDCLAGGRALAKEDGRLALLVLGDGSACRSAKAPGAFDDRAEPFDQAVATALATADTGALAGLDPVLARQLHAAGRPGWQLLAGAAEGGDLAGRLLYDEAPYGVGYLVASWS